MGGDLAVPSDVRALDTFVFARVGTSVERESSGHVDPMA